MRRLGRRAARRATHAGDFAIQLALKLFHPAKVGGMSVTSGDTGAAAGFNELDLLALARLG